eukprot:g27565.t1
MFLAAAEVLSCSTIFKSSEEICRWFFHQAVGVGVFEQLRSRVLSCAQTASPLRWLAFASKSLAAKAAARRKGIAAGLHLSALKDGGVIYSWRRSAAPVRSPVRCGAAVRMVACGGDHRQDPGCKRCPMDSRPRTPAPMRKTQSVPSLKRAPLYPGARPSGPWPIWSSYRTPALRWENPDVKLANLQAYQDRSGWAEDAFHIHRPLNQRLERPRPQKVWRLNEVGSKYLFNERSCNLKEAASSNWDMWRPANHCVPPWKNSVYPRAVYNSVAANSASMVQ